MELHINGKRIPFEPGQTILEVARTNGIDIPVLCYLERAYPIQSCQICIVEIAGSETLLPACATPAGAGMRIQTESPAVQQARKTTLQMLAQSIRHPRPLANQSGDTSLQQLIDRYGVQLPSVQSPEETATAPYATEDIVYRPEHCILCHRCVVACRELKGIGAIEIIKTRQGTRVVPSRPEVCESCGECLRVCPTMALTDAVSPYRDRIWQGPRTQTTCGYCGCGCRLELNVHQDRVVGISTRSDHAVNQGSLCVKGRFGYEFIHSEQRLTRPWIRKDGSLKPATWDEALSTVAERLRHFRDTQGPNSIGGLASAKCTNEENYLFQKLFRGVIGTHNVDHCARLCHASTVTGLSAAFGSGAMTNPIRDVLRSRVILVTGSNMTENHPIFANYVIEAVLKHGARLMVVDPRRICLTRLAEIWLQPRVGTNIAWINGLMHIILRENWHASAYIEERTTGFSEFRKGLEKYTPDHVAHVTGIPQSDLYKAAELFGTLRPGAILYAMGITQHVSGTDNVKALADLSMLTGNVGVEGGGLNPLRGQNNVQGACDMGCLPHVFPGYQPVSNPNIRKQFAAAWGIETIPSGTGLTSSEMLSAAHQGEIRALYVMGENPMLSEPHQDHVRESLNRLGLLVVQDIFMTETARIADVVLPGACFAEKEGTFTNSERVVQPVHRAVSPPGRAREDLWIVHEIARRMGAAWGPVESSEVMKEIGSLTPSYGGITHERLAAGDLTWPCPHPDHPGTPRLHEKRFAAGLGRFFAVEQQAPAEGPSETYPMILTTGRVGPHFHTGTMTRKGVGLTRLYPEMLAEMNPKDAKQLHIADGQRIRISSARGSLETKVLICDRPDRGVIFVPFHFHESPANALTHTAMDPVAMIPEFKVSAVKVEKLEG
ncbi:MAG: formate dehydrogenase subunit alpha [Desulfatiglandaceae bacterium]